MGQRVAFIYIIPAAELTSFAIDMFVEQIELQRQRFHHGFYHMGSPIVVCNEELKVNITGSKLAANQEVLLSDGVENTSVKIIRALNNAIVKADTYMHLNQ